MAKYRIKAILLALVILTVYLLSACQSVEHTYIKTKAKARTEVWKAITNGTASSASVAIMDNGKLIYTDAFGMADRENNIPADK
ncbi:MAG: serine hydrolase, partial [Eubacteriales bacterium]|nr:serine hydrolase [Eubacteriales bacterium]